MTDPLKKLYAPVFHMLLYVRKDIAGRITLHEFILNLYQYAWKNIALH